MTFESTFEDVTWTAIFNRQW